MSGMRLLLRGRGNGEEQDDEGAQRRGRGVPSAPHRADVQLWVGAIASCGPDLARACDLNPAVKYETLLGCGDPSRSRPLRPSFIHSRHYDAADAES